MRVCFRNSDDRIIESQSGDGGLAVLTANAMAAGFSESQFRCEEISDSAFAALLAAQNAADRAAIVPQSVSDRQFFQQLAVMGAITTGEALAAVKTGAIPADLQTFIDTLPSDQQFAAEMLLSGATVFERNHPMTLALGAGMGWTTEQLDALWQAAAAL